MIAIALSKVVRSPRIRIWRALTSPEELIRWDERLLSLEEPAPDYPTPGRGARWRCMLGSVPIELHGEALEVVPSERLRSSIRLGAFCFEETWTLADAAPAATRLSLRLTAENKIPVVGGLLDRFDVRRFSAGHVDSMLTWLQRWCERDPS